MKQDFADTLLLDKGVERAALAGEDHRADCAAQHFQHGNKVLSHQSSHFLGDSHPYVLFTYLLLCGL